MAAPILFRPEPEAFEERHYSVGELAKLWGLSEHMVRDLFGEEPGVVRLGNRLTTCRRRHYVTLRIPASVVARVHARLQSG